MGRDQSEIDVRDFIVCYGHARHHLLKAVGRCSDADPREVPAQPSRPPAAKNLMSQLQLMRDLPSFVATGVRRGRHKWEF